MAMDLFLKGGPLLLRRRREFQQRAKTFFAARGIAATVVEATAPRTMQSFTIESYQKRFTADDPGGGAALGIEFMHNVLRHAGEITIIEGWR